MWRSPLSMRARQQPDRPFPRELAAFQAVADAGLSRNSIDTSLPVPLVLGISSSAIEILEQSMKRLLAQGPSHVPYNSIDAGRLHQAAGLLTRHITLLTSSTTVSSACSAGLDAIASAVALIREGRAEGAVAGGADAPINSLMMACLAKSRLIAHHDNPSKASCPFTGNNR